ncbi:MAG: holin [Burkholderiales bacterium]|nr:holin [Burkholderiales bacterium]
MNANYMEPLKASPPVTISAISLLGIPLNEWVFILTIIYTVLQITIFLRDKVVKPWLYRRANKQKGKQQK